MNLKSLFVACVLMLALPAVAFSQVYRWVDSQGRVHFSDKAPPDQKVDTVALPEVEATPSADVLPEADALERQRRLVQVLEEERLERERLKAEAKAEAEKKAAYCERFKNRLERMESASLLYSENDDGTVKYWKDQDADRFKREQRALFQQECSPA
jgi:hypothetical protein